MSWQQEYETKCDAYELQIDSRTAKKKWNKRGINGDLIIYSNVHNLNDLKVRFELHSIQIWWKIFNPKLKKKGSKTRVVTFKRLSTNEENKETIALRFRNPQICQSFIAKWESLTRDIEYETTDDEKDIDARERYMHLEQEDEKQSQTKPSFRDAEPFAQIADKSSFRDVIKLDRLPSIDLIDADMILNEYYFNYEIKDEIQIKNNQINYANSSYGKFANDEHYLALWMNSEVMRRVFANQYKRPKLNMVIVLDKSESMKESLCVNELSRMEIAQQAISRLIRHSLDKQDRFALITFNEHAVIEYGLTVIDSLPYGMVQARRNIADIEANGVTDLEEAYKTAMSLFNEAILSEDEYYNRIMFMTDLQLDPAKSAEYNAKEGIFGMIKDAAEHNKVYTTFLSMGVEQNKTLFDNSLYGVQGCNFLSVHNKNEFISKFHKEQEFPYMIRPIFTDLEVRLDAKIQKVYTNNIDTGDIKKGELLKIGSVFGNLNYSTPLIIKFVYAKHLKLSIGFVDKNGTRNQSEQLIDLTYSEEKDDKKTLVKEKDFYESVGVRKVVLLCRYVDVLKKWIKVDGKSMEKESQPKLIVSVQFRKEFAKFVEYFEQEMNAINDMTLKKELDVLKKLAVYQDTVDID